MRTLLFVALFLAPSVALAKKPPPPPSWKCADADAYGAADDALDAGRNDEAAAGFAEVLGKEPTCGLALVGRGRALLGGGKAGEAVPLLVEATVAFPDKLDAHLWLGRARFAAGDDDGAIAAAKAAIALKPGSVDAQKIAQEALLRKGDHAGAHASLAAARAVANVVAWNCLEGFVFAAEGDAAKAGEMLAACQGTPDSALYDALAAKVGALGAAAPGPEAGTPAVESGAEAGVEKAAATPAVPAK